MASKANAPEYVFIVLVSTPGQPFNEKVTGHLSLDDANKYAKEAAKDPEQKATVYQAINVFGSVTKTESLWQPSNNG
jgi:hypothetical protein